MYRWLDHTAELALELAGDTPEQLFHEALAAFAELVAGGAQRAERLRVPVELEAATPADLLVAWLEELVFLADTEQLVPEHAEALALDRGQLRAVVVGSRGAPRPLVKAVTYHGLRFEREGDGWHAGVVLDV